MQTLGAIADLRLTRELEDCWIRRYTQGKFDQSKQGRNSQEWMGELRNHNAINPRKIALSEGSDLVHNPSLQNHFARFVAFRGSP